MRQDLVMESAGWLLSRGTSGNYIVRKLDPTVILTQQPLSEPRPKLTNETLREPACRGRSIRKQSPTSCFATMGEVPVAV